MSATVSVVAERLAGYPSRVDRLVAEHIASRIAQADDTVWGPLAQPEASIRLGWVNDPRDMVDLVDQLENLRTKLQSQQVDRVVLCGMGGSSLAPEVMAKAAKADLVILDSTHPDQVARAVQGDLGRTVVVVSSKSGTTVETATARVTFEEAFRARGLDPRERVIIVTDPDSPLHRDAEEAGHRVFLADPTVGGRFSALTAFGLVPATLAGVNTRAIIRDAAEVWPSLHRDDPRNPAIALAAALAGPSQDVALLLPHQQDLPGLGDWIEQLVAESTGKEGKGVLPVVAESNDAPESALALVDVVRITLGGDAIDAGVDVAVQAPLGAQFLLWEYATAMLGYLLELNPFDQPDVESAKVAARSLLDSPQAEQKATLVLPEMDVWVGGMDDHPPVGSLQEAWELLRTQLGESGYLSVQLYVDREMPIQPNLRHDLAKAVGRPVTVGFGPRFLHSTGQFHKGGTPDGVFFQVEVVGDAQVAIPGYPYDFQGLISAQAAGDRAVLIGRGRPVLAVRVHSVEHVPELFRQLTRVS